MKKIYLLLFIFLIGCSQQGYHDLNGNTVKFSDYHGKWIVINYWASWCKPCSQEIPELNNFYAANKGKNMVMFGVNYDYAPVDKLPEIVQRMGVKFPTLTTDPAKEFGIKHLTGLPATVLIAPNGELKEILYGVQTQSGLETIMGLGIND